MMEGSDQTTNEQVNDREEQPVDPMEDFGQQLEDIINTYGSASSLMQEQISILENEENKEAAIASEEIISGEAGPEKEQADSKLHKGLGEEATSLLQSLNKLSSPEEKVEMALKKYAELVEKHKSEKQQLEHRQGLLVKQRDQIQFEHSRAILARGKLEMLCRELHRHNKMLKEESLQRLQEDEMKRREITAHFQSTLVDIQGQIEQHSSRNNKLCQENSELANKLKTLIDQYERREQSLEKIFKHRDLQQKLSDAKLQEANMLLNQAEEKHKREKEYLLKEAIDKTKKCYAMREQELQMKKQLVLYSQKFEEFQATLGKSNDIYVTFKQEMDKMTKKMKKLEKESNIWKTRFESCNKALVEMIEERSEKAKEFELFTVKIDRLETLCRALQDERKCLYSKIQDIRFPDKAAISPPQVDELPDIAQLSNLAPSPLMTAEMEKLRQEQIRLQEFAAALATPIADDSGETDSEEDESKLEFPTVPEVPKIELKKETDELKLIQEEPSIAEDNKPEAVVADEKKQLPTNPEPTKLEAETKSPQDEEKASPTNLEPTKPKAESKPPQVEEKPSSTNPEPTKPKAESKPPQVEEKPIPTNPEPTKPEAESKSPQVEEKPLPTNPEPTKPEAESKPPQVEEKPLPTNPEPTKPEAESKPPQVEEKPLPTNPEPTKPEAESKPPQVEEKPLPTNSKLTKPEAESKPSQEPQQPEITEQQESAKEKPKQEVVTKVEAIKQETVKQGPTEPRPVVKEEAIPEQKNVAVVKSELPKTESSKQESPKEEHVQKDEAASDGAKAQATKSKAPKSQEAKSKNGKPQSKKQATSKKKGSAKGGNKS
ncbi:beta-taxilin isoform X2 [Misgurnus anguillicaudatus]|uniref:beta-taxilin isoform X2 n=1 Tax=Misgurnus anguillicaudatus TaxID=75329 RepID=UPI003CCF20DB